MIDVVQIWSHTKYQDDTPSTHRPMVYCIAWVRVWSVLEQWTSQTVLIILRSVHSQTMRMGQRTWRNWMPHNTPPTWAASTFQDFSLPPSASASASQAERDYYIYIYIYIYIISIQCSSLHLGKQEAFPTVKLPYSLIIYISFRFLSSSRKCSSIVCYDTNTHSQIRGCVLKITSYISQTWEHALHKSTIDIVHTDLSIVQWEDYRLDKLHTVYHRA